MRRHHTVVANLRRVLGDGRVNEARGDVVHNRGGGIKGDHGHLIRFVGAFDTVGSTESRKEVGTKDPRDVGVARQNGLKL